MRDVSDDYVRHVCRNSLFLRVLRIRSLAQEYDPATANAAELGTPPTAAGLVLCEGGLTCALVLGAR
jgi:hypothetical protein